MQPELGTISAETTHPFEPYENKWNFTEPNADFAFTKKGQAEYLTSLLHLAKHTFAVNGRSTGVYWWCPECADGYWLNFSNSYYHSALFDHSGVANPAQQAWQSDDPQPSACVVALEAACPWVGGQSINTVEVAVAAGELGKNG